MKKTKNYTNLTTCDVLKLFLPFQELANLFLCPCTNKTYCSIDRKRIIQNNSEVEQKFITISILCHIIFSYWFRAESSYQVNKK